MQRKASAQWKGGLKEGKGTVSSSSGVFSNTPFSFGTRFENAPGTNPEELIAAAHAGCFTMKLSFVLGEAGVTADEIETKCDVTLEKGAITKSHLTVKAKVPGIEEQKFQECAENARANCPVSKLLNTDISMEAVLSR